MLEWLRRLRGKSQPPLKGAPAFRRQKTYSSQSGYVYVYYYEGWRWTEREEQGAEYVFAVSADRKNYFPVSVMLPEASIDAWEDAHHQLRQTERYAIAKMALFQAFDERATPAQMKHEVLVRRADAESILSTLELD
jgi:hypothetical protein